MQTFLPYPDFAQTAQVLDRARLGCQRKEALQIIDTCLAKRQGHESGWTRHPAVLMWENHLHALCQYGIAICLEWKRRGYVENCLPRFEAFLNQQVPSGMPDWIGYEPLHLAYRSNLLRKAYERLEQKGKRDVLDWYLAFEWQVSIDLEYIWPTKG